jgi:tetratricopeptide (TPR) repeat protein
MGAVYVAKDTLLNREIAVKVLLEKQTAGSGSASTRRFQDEAQITGQLQHPGIPPVHDIGDLHDGRPFLAMKLIRGDTLEKLLRDRPNTNHDRGRFIAVFEQVCNAVAYAHAHRIVHRDLKPSNVMVGSFGEVQVMDWGLAKVLKDSDSSDSALKSIEATHSETEEREFRRSDELATQAGSILGTPAYMPPEQAIGAIHEVDTRSDVFGLGGILAAILTGTSPFVGKTPETTRILAARGEVDACFDRLDACGADPCLVALAKRCLAPRREDRPADAQAVAAEVAALRAEADDRARRVEIELAAENAAKAERQKRRRVWLGAAAAVVLAVVCGLAAVMAVQRQANNDLATANSQLAAKNEALNSERAKVEHRFDLARKAIASLHTSVDEQPELGNETFRPLRKKLLETAAEFYRELEGLLAEQSDEKSQTALADSLSELASLTSKIGDPREALVIQRKELALRQELAVRQEAGVEAQVAVSIAARRVGAELLAMGDPMAALHAFEEAREQASRLRSQEPNNDVLQALAACNFSIGVAQRHLGERELSLNAYQQAQELSQELVLKNPTVARYQSELADSYNNIANLLDDSDKALASHERARELRQRLSEDYPDVVEYQSDLAQSLYNIANLMRRKDRSAALAAHQKARDVRQKIARAHPAVNRFRSDLAASYHSIGIVLDQLGQTGDSLAAFENCRDINQKLVNDQPTNTDYQDDLASNYNSIAIVQIRLGEPSNALAAFEIAREIRQKLVADHPEVPGFRVDLASTYKNISLLQKQLGKMEEALAAIESSQGHLQTLLKDAPTNADYKKDLADCHLKMSEAHIHLGRIAQGVEHLKKYVDILRADPNPPSNIGFELARALARLASFGNNDESGITQTDSDRFADQATSLLAEAIEGGRIQKEELQSSDFDSLRGRANFQQLQETATNNAEKPTTKPLQSP